MQKVIARNKQARRLFEIEQEFEAGLVLQGSEVKSLRAGKASLDEAFCRPIGDALYLIGCHIAEYPQAHRRTHEPRRERKLLLHRRELDRILTRVTERGYALVPLELYWKDAHVKLKIGLGRGKKVHDRREDLKERDARREIERALKSR